MSDHDLRMSIKLSPNTMDQSDKYLELFKIVTE